MEQFREFQLSKRAKENNVESIPLLIWVNKKKTLSFWNTSWHKVQDLFKIIMSVRQDVCGEVYVGTCFTGAERLDVTDINILFAYLVVQNYTPNVSLQILMSTTVL